MLGVFCWLVLATSNGRAVKMRFVRGLDWLSQNPRKETGVSENHIFRSRIR